MEGPLSVWSNFYAGWHLCWVLLDEKNGMLFRFKNHHQRRQRRGLLTKFSGINLLGAIVTKDPTEPTGFSVVSEGREYRFQAPSEAQRDSWVMELEEAVLRQMVCRRAYHIWDRRYIGPTLALVNAKLQDAGLLYEELACTLQDLDRRWSSDDGGQRARWPGVIHDLLAFLTTARAAMALLENLKAMILPGLVAQLETMQPRKKAATMLSLLKTHAAGLAVDPLSMLLRRNPQPTAEGAALLEPAVRRSRSRICRPLPEMAPSEHSSYMFHPSSSRPHSPPRSEHGVPAASSPSVRSMCSTTRPTAGDDSSYRSASTNSVTRFITAASSVERSDLRADKSSRSAATVATAASKWSAHSGQNSSEGSQEAENEPSDSSILPQPHGAGTATLSGSNVLQSPQPKQPETTPVDTAVAWWNEPASPTARNLRELCAPLQFGSSMLSLDYPMPLLQPRSLLVALADLFACPELFAEISMSTRASERMLRVLRWYLASLYYVKRGDDVTKPLAPVLGETYRCSWQLVRDTENLGDVTYAAEQVSVNPPVTCVHAECVASGVEARVRLQPDAFCVGSYVQLRLHGLARIHLTQYAEEYALELPTGCMRDIASKPWFELCGAVSINCQQTGYRAKMKFIAKSPQPSSQRHSVQVEVYNPFLNRPFVRVRGRWNDNLTAMWASGEVKEFLSKQLLNQSRRPPSVIFNDDPKSSDTVWRGVIEVLSRRNFHEAYRRREELQQGSTSDTPFHRPALFKKQKDNSFIYKPPDTSKQSSTGNSLQLKKR